ncbi:FAD-dependent oxidoreductase [Inhella proteolytica]|uniref:FAD-dependent oxidoreductase n=1 Tax=Inhella proteolytica TaxID=2795029 RepID=A0A931J7G6_9BURK|nr:FAD-dependent oxidoreductase [Inhella proteolytica]MBH9579641.1 FAD-dependent oxidoreductase [Inhella proteolytica]
MLPTNVSDPNYFHQVVDCQWACPAHTPVPEYIRLIAQGRFDEAYMVNWVSNVFPGILGRTCDRPCEPACRRGRVEEENLAKPEPVAICRLKRVAADLKGDEVRALMPAPLPKTARNGKRVACVGAGPASLTVARDLATQGYAVTVFDGEAKAGGFMRSQVPRFRLPEEVIDEEVGHILHLGVELKAGQRIDSMKDLLTQGYDAVFVGCGAPRGRDLNLPGRWDAAAGQIHIGIDWLASVSFGHIEKVGKKVLVLGGGNTAMDCCRSARRLGADSVQVLVRSTYEDMKASPWEKEDAEHEGIPILPCHSPKAFLIDNGVLVGMRFEIVQSVYENGQRKLVPSGQPDVDVPCDEVLIAVGQENAFPWIERDAGIEFDRWGLPVLDAVTHQSSLPQVFFGGDAAFGPKNIITAVAHGHEAAVSIDRLLHGEDVKRRPPPHVNLMSQKMGIHQWSYDNAPINDARHKVPWAAAEAALKSIKVEVELGFDVKTAFKEAQRCLNCDVQTVFTAKQCIECDACVDICPTDCISFTANAESPEQLELRVPRLHPEQPLMVSESLKTGRVMVKDEDVCLHCGLCAERCPTGAWDMQKFLLLTTKAGPACRGAFAQGSCA